MIISNKKDLSQFLFLGMEDSIVFLGKPRQRTIEILPKGVGDFPTLYSLGDILYTCISVLY